MKSTYKLHMFIVFDPYEHESHSLTSHPSNFQRVTTSHFLWSSDLNSLTSTETTTFRHIPNTHCNVSQSQKNKPGNEFQTFTKSTVIIVDKQEKLFCPECVPATGYSVIPFWGCNSSFAFRWVFLAKISIYTVCSRRIRTLIVLWESGFSLNTLYWHFKKKLSSF